MPALIELARARHGSDVLILQSQGPIRDPSKLSYETQLLLNVGAGLCEGMVVLSALGVRLLLLHSLTAVTLQGLFRLSDHVRRCLCCFVGTVLLLGHTHRQATSHPNRRDPSLLQSSPVWL